MSSKEKDPSLLWIMFPASVGFVSLFGLSLIEVLSGNGHETFSVGVLTKMEALGASNWDVLLLGAGLAIAGVIALVFWMYNKLEEISLLKKYPKKEKSKVVNEDI